MEKLPKYFLIKSDKNNPLWQKYIDWLKDEYGSRWDGTLNGYYGFDDNKMYKSGVGVYFSLENEELSNDPTVITLEQWDKAVNGFTEKWYIRTTKESNKTICDWFDSLKEAHKTDRTVGNYFTYLGEGWMHFAYPKHTEGLTEITFEQFKKHVLKQEEKMESKINIVAPDGYEVDEERSNAKTIYFKKIEPKKELLTWEDMVKEMYGKMFFISERGGIESATKFDGFSSDSNIFRTEAQAEKALALAQMMVIADYYNDGWTPDYNNLQQIKYALCVEGRIIESYMNSGYVVFKSLELASKAYLNNREIFETYFAV